MTIEEAIKLKEEIQFKIYELIVDFEKQTHLSVASISVQRTPSYGDVRDTLLATIIKTESL